jgi:hypothetical protein
VQSSAAIDLAEARMSDHNVFAAGEARNGRPV